MTVYMCLYAYNIESQEYFVSDEQSMTPNSIIQRNVILLDMSVLLFSIVRGVRVNWRYYELYSNEK